MPTHYDTLELPQNANLEQIERAYKQLRLLYERDPARLAMLDQAWSVLANPMTKKQYDGTLKQAGASARLHESSKSMAAQRVAPTPSSGRSRTEVIEVLKPPTRSPGLRRQTTDIMDVESPEVTLSGAAPGISRGGRKTTEVIDVHSPVGESNPALAKSRPTGRPGGVTEMGPGAPQGVNAELGIGESESALIEIYYAGETRLLRLRPGEYIVGRPSSKGPQPDIPLQDPELFISRQHATIYYERNQWWLKDNGSHNGTCVNGRRLPPKQPWALQHEDLIDIEKRRLTFRFE